MMMKYQYTVIYKQQPENQIIFESLEEVYATIIKELHEDAIFFLYYGIENTPRVAGMEIVHSELNHSGYVYLFSGSYEKGLTVRKKVVI